MNDKQKDANFKQFLLDAFSCVRNASTLGASAYIFHADTEGLNFRWAFMEAGFTLKQCLVWAKNVFVLGRQDYHWQHEPILYGWLEGKAHYFINDRTQSTLLRDVELDFNSMKKGELLSYIKERVPTSETNATVVYENKPTRSELHPTMKPVRLVARLINNSSKLGQIVLDPFAGSGSTIMACEYLGRRARAAELDPRFCDVIVKRYIEVTEKTDVKCVRGGREFTLEELNKLPMPNTGTGRCAALHRIDVYIGNIDEARIIPQKLGVQHNGKTKDTFYRISYKT